MKRAADTKTKTPYVSKTAEGRYRGREPWRGGKSETFDSYKEACDYVARRRAAGKGSVDTQQEAQHSGTVTMHDVWLSYLQLRSDWSPNTRAARVRYWQTMRPLVGTVSPDHLTNAHATKVRNALQKVKTRSGHMTDGTIRNHLMLLNALVSYSIDQGWRSKASNPVKASKVAKAAGSRRGEGRKRALPQDICEQLIEQMPDRTQLAGYLAHQCGLRSGEVRGLQVDRVHFFRDQLTIDRQLLDVDAGADLDDCDWRDGRTALQAPKTENSERTIDVPHEVIEAIAAHLAAFPSKRFVLTGDSTGRPLSKHQLQRGWDTARDALEGLLPRQDVRFHDLRHSFVTDLLDRNVPPQTVAELAGHGSPSITLDVYAHSTDAGRSMAKAAMQARCGNRTNAAQTEGVAAAR